MTDEKFYEEIIESLRREIDELMDTIIDLRFKLEKSKENELRDFLRMLYADVKTELQKEKYKQTDLTVDEIDGEIKNNDKEILTNIKNAIEEFQKTYKISL